MVEAAEVRSPPLSGAVGEVRSRRLLASQRGRCNSSDCGQPGHHGYVRLDPLGSHRKVFLGQAEKCGGVVGGGRVVVVHLVQGNSQTRLLQTNNVEISKLL